MSNPIEMAYTYDGSFSGFLTCVYESYVHNERPVCFSTPDAALMTLWPERQVETNEAHGSRVYRSLSQRISLDAQCMVRDGFLTCLSEKERHLCELIRLGYKSGPSLTRNLTDDRVSVVWKALRHLYNEVHLLKGFVRFSDQDGLLLAEIEPKNWVLPLLRPHFCARYSGETFAIYDRVHGEALFYEPHRWAVVPMDEFQILAPGQAELDFRRLWRRFYDTVAIKDRYNPKCRMTHMPKRYWNTMTEFQTEEAPALPARKEA